MRKQVGIMLMFLATGICAKAQNERDAFRYAQYSPTGTARYSSLAGSMGAFGADFTGLSAGNPAGIGLFKRHEIAVSTALAYNKIVSAYNGEEERGVDYRFRLNSLGVVCVLSPPANTKWKMLHFATGLNKLARYDGFSVVAGENEGSNFCQYLVGIANGINHNSLSGFAGAAWDHFLLDSIATMEYYTPVDADFHQQQLRVSEGYLNEYIFSFGGNYNDELFLGATLGIPFFRYYQHTTYTESSNSYFDTLIVFDEFRSQATGINFKLGLIYQPLRYLRVGAAFHTPTFYPNVREEFENSFDVWNILLDSALHSNLIYNSERKKSDYQLRTPYHAMANVAFIYRDRGFINVDYEYVDYTNSELYAKSHSFHSFGEENKNIRANYRGTHIARIGGELNLQPIALRLGYAYASNPYSKEVEKDGSSHTICAGIGIRGKSFFADFAYMYKFSQDKDVFYDHISVNPYSSVITNQLFALTLGWKIKR